MIIHDENSSEETSSEEEEEDIRNRLRRCLGLEPLNFEEEENEEEEAPEPIYDINPNATDIEICNAFTNLLN